MTGPGKRFRALIRVNQLQVEGRSSKTKYSLLFLISWVNNAHASPNSVLLIGFIDLVLVAARSVEGSHV